MSGLQDFKCPCCGGTVEFNAGTQSMKCPYCDTEFDIEALQQKEKKQEEKKEDSYNWGETASSHWTEEETAGLMVYSCNSCGGEIVGDENMGATQCPYCGSQIVLAGKFAGDLKPDYVIPFKFDKSQAKAAFENFISDKKYAPKLFKSKKHIEEIKGIYVPFWLFDADANGEASYDAAIIDTHTSGDYITTTTSHYSASRSGKMKFANVPVDGSSRIADDMMESIEPFNFADAVPFNTAYLAGFAADKYDIDAEGSIDRANQRIKESMEQALEQTVTSYQSGKRIRDYDTVQLAWSSVDIENGTAKYALYPVWMLSATYEGKPYTFAMNGQTGKFVGDLPVDKKALNKYFWKCTGIIGAVLYLASVALLLV